MVRNGFRPPTVLAPKKALDNQIGPSVTPIWVIPIANTLNGDPLGITESGPKTKLLLEV